MTSRNVTSAALVIAVASARPLALSGAPAACSSTSRLARSINSVWSRSSSTAKRAGTLASNGNCCSSRVHSAWMVCTFSPPGVSSAQANSLRAVNSIARSTSRMPVSRIAAASVASSIATHCPSLPNTRSDMLAAAALVKVMQRIFSGGTPSSSSRTTRCTSTWVLPEPALAETNTDASGSDARTWRAAASKGILRGALIADPRRARRPPTIP